MTEPSTQWIHDVAVDAYVYLYPLVTMELTRRQMTNVVEPSGTHGPMNAFAHVRQFPGADFREVVRPNFDTLYSLAWLDLSEGPVVVSVGEDADDRYYELPMYDMWTDCFAVPGQRTSGTGPGSWAVTPPGWVGALPDGVERIDAPTSIVWIIGRTQTNGPSDYPAVRSFQDTMSIVPLAAWGAAERPVVRGVVDPSIDMSAEPLSLVNSMDTATFFDLALALLAEHPAHLTDGPTLMRMARAGLVAGARFSDLDEGIRGALADVPGAGLERLQRSLPRLANVVDGWQVNIETMGVYGNSYTKRAIVTMVGLGANSAEDAIYPLALADADGKVLDGSNEYVLHFDADELPPVNAFWSLTMYDADGFQVPNPLDRFAIGDRDDLVYGADGSVDLLLQPTSPGPDKESNWLPSVPGVMGLTMRLYSPKHIVLQGDWTPPAVRRVS